MRCARCNRKITTQNFFQIDKVLLGKVVRRRYHNRCIASSGPVLFHLQPREEEIRLITLPKNAYKEIRLE